MTRSERQDQCVQRWVDNKCRGTIEAATGFGKTRVGLLAIKRFLKANPTKKVIVVVPSDPIKEQWNRELIDWGLFQQTNTKTMADVSKNKYECDLLVVDECHKSVAATLVLMFENIKRKILLCLTATLERLDGRDEIIRKMAPVVDVITVEEAIKNNWLSSYKEYKVLLDVEDIDDYFVNNREFYEHFAYFDNNFTLAMNCHSDWKVRAEYSKKRLAVYINSLSPAERATIESSDEFKRINRETIIHAAGFNRTLQARKKFINHHPKKIEIANYILEHRQDKKCVTFSATIGMAEQIGYGLVYSGKDSVKKGRTTLAEFVNRKGGVLNTIMKLNEGFNCPDVSVSIVLGLNSSPTVAAQRLGRVIRQKEGKEAEVFNLIIRGTVEEQWFQKSHANTDYITIDEDGLKQLLEGDEYTPLVNKKSKMLFRF